MDETENNPPATQDGDDISVNTVPAENGIINNVREPEEYVVKFLFRPKNASNNSQVAKTHYSILSAITQFSPDTKIYDNYGVTMKKLVALKSYDEYLRHFNLKFVKGNEDKNRGPIYLVHHRIISTVSLG